MVTLTKSWLDDTNDADFQEVSSFCDNPFEFLYDRKIFDRIVTVLSPRGDVEQRTLFDPDRSSVDDLRDDLQGIIDFRERGHPLWRRFSKKVKQKVRNLTVPSPPLEEFFRRYLVPFIKLNSVHDSCHGASGGWSARRSLDTHLPLKEQMKYMYLGFMFML
jgi:hypothetical protein